jgi:hypothetical protein
MHSVIILERLLYLFLGSKFYVPLITLKFLRQRKHILNKQRVNADIHLQRQFLFSILIKTGALKQILIKFSHHEHH